MQALAIRPGGRFIDGTLGGGGHAAAILQASSPDGTLLALDADSAALSRARERLESHLAREWHSSTVHLPIWGRWLANTDGTPLTVSCLIWACRPTSWPTRRAAFRLRVVGLDMRFDPTRGEPASALLNELSSEELADLLYRYGEERASRRIARAIVAARPIQSAQQLADVVAKARGGRRGKIHPATQTFQALRIAVNDELGALEAVLPQAVELLKPGGRLAVITFHSLEDRIVKNFYRTESRDCICPVEQLVCTCGHRATLKIITAKPIEPTAAEVAANPRARSAKLRAAERL